MYTTESYGIIFSSQRGNSQCTEIKRSPKKYCQVKKNKLQNYSPSTLPFCGKGEIGVEVISIFACITKKSPKDR